MDHYASAVAPSQLLFSSNGKFVNIHSRKDRLLKMQRNNMTNPICTPAGMISPDQYATELPRLSLDGAAPTRSSIQNKHIASFLNKQRKDMISPLISSQIYAREAPRHSLDSSAAAFSTSKCQMTASPTRGMIGPDHYITAAPSQFSSAMCTAAVDKLLNVSSGMIGPKHFAITVPPQLSLDATAAVDFRKGSSIASSLKQRREMTVIPDVPSGRIGLDHYAWQHKLSSNGTAAADFADYILASSLFKKKSIDAANNDLDHLSTCAAQDWDHYATLAAWHDCADGEDNESCRR